MKGKYLIHCDSWFTAPDGMQYKAVFGNVEILTDDYLGIKTNRNAHNWFAKVGSEENHVIIAGCQIHYSVKCEKVNAGRCIYNEVQEGKAQEFDILSRIYVPEPKDNC